jgi:dUTP pyrophosphatase
MLLEIFPLHSKEKLEQYYLGLTRFKGDVGLDIFCLETIEIPPGAISFKIPLGIKCRASELETLSYTYRISVGYYLYPRSSLGSKTSIRLSNSVGIIDPGYRGELIACVDNIDQNQPVTMVEGERYFQLISPDLKFINFTIESLDKLDTTDRNSHSFGDA